MWGRITKKRYPGKGMSQSVLSMHRAWLLAEIKRLKTDVCETEKAMLRRGEEIGPAAYDDDNLNKGDSKWLNRP